MSVDKNYESHVAENGIVIENRIIPSEGVNPNDYSDILKFSNCTNIEVRNCSIYGGKEDCIDAVRGSKYTFNNLSLIPICNGITIKGSIEGISVNDTTLETHGKDCDMEFGQFDNYWYIGRPPTRNIIFKNVKAQDGKPVIIKLWDADKPTIENSNVKIVKIPKFIWWPYFVIRAIQTRGLKNITKPVDSGVFIKTI